MGLESSPHLYALGRLWRRHRHSHKGVGIVPLSVVACLFKGMFSIAFQVVLLAAFVFGVRAFALFLIASAERYQES